MRFHTVFLTFFFWFLLWILGLLTSFLRLIGCVSVLVEAFCWLSFVSRFLFTFPYVNIPYAKENEHKLEFSHSFANVSLAM